MELEHHPTSVNYNKLYYTVSKKYDSIDNKQTNYDILLIIIIKENFLRPSSSHMNWYTSICIIPTKKIREHNMNMRFRQNKAKLWQLYDLF